MTSAKTLSALALRRLSTPSWAPDGHSGGQDGLPSPKGVAGGASHMGHALREANDLAWIALEVMLAGDRLGQRNEEDHPDLRIVLRKVVDLLLDKVAPEAFRRADPEWRLGCWQQLRAARDAGLLTIDFPGAKDAFPGPSVPLN